MQEAQTQSSYTLRCSFSASHSPLLKVVETSRWAQKNHNVRIYVSAMKVRNPPEAYFSPKNGKTVPYCIEILKKTNFISHKLILVDS